MYSASLDASATAKIKSCSIILNIASILLSFYVFLGKFSFIKKKSNERYQLFSLIVPVLCTIQQVVMIAAQFGVLSLIIGKFSSSLFGLFSFTLVLLSVDQYLVFTFSKQKNQTQWNMILLQAVSAILVITLIVANCWTVQNMANTVLEILVAFNDVVILSLNWKMTKLTLARKRYLINHFSDISDAKRKKEMLANLGEKYKIQAKSNESLTNLAKSTESDTSGLSSKNIYMMSKKKNFIANRNEKLKQTKSLKLKLYCAFGLSTILSAVGCAFFLLELTFFLTGSIEYFSIFSSISIFQAMLLLFLSDSFVDGVEINTAELSIKSDKKPATMLNSVTVLENRNLQSSNQTIEQEISVGMQRENKEHALKQNPKPLRIQISNSNKEFRGTVSEEIRRY